MLDSKEILFKRRAFILGVLKLGITTAMVGRLGFLQIAEHKKYTLLSKKNRVKVQFHQPIRGIIFDRRQIPIATSKQTFKVVVVAQETKNTQRTLHRVAKITNLSTKYIEKVTNLIRKTPRFIPVPIKNNLSWSEVSKIEINNLELDGVYIEEYLSRHYPYNNILSHVLGYVSPLSLKDKAHINPKIKKIPFVQVGKYGLERVHNEKLIGTPGNRQIEIDARNHPVRTISETASQKGTNLHTTIDLKLQKFVFKRLQRYKSASCIVLDVNNGDIMAMVSHPGFDPNAFVHSISNDHWEELQHNPYAVMTNKCISGLYPPGSIIKPMIALHALTEKIITPDTTHNCRSFVKINRREFHCWREEGHGKVDLKQAIAQSCDCYFYNLAKQLKMNNIAKMARSFGLGVLTDMNWAEEKAGLIPDPSWKSRVHGQSWYLGDTVNATIGQGYMNTTPLQMAIMMATIANGGNHISPRLFMDQPIKSLNLDLPLNDIQIIKDTLFEVVNGKKGSARFYPIRHPDMLMSGKTGTSQVRGISKKEREDGVIKNKDLPWALRDHAIFVGFAPFERPRFAVAVVVEHGGFGSPIATPIARDVLTFAQKHVI